MQDKTIRLRKGKKGKLRPGHPWIFKSQIINADTALKPGEIASIITNEGKFVGRGYYNPASGIAVRMLTFQDKTIDEQFLSERIKEAVLKRDFLNPVTNARRLVFSEADGLPGLIADLYNNTLVLQFFTLGMECLKGTIVRLMKDIINPEFIYEKSDSQYRKIERLKPLKGWIGPSGKTSIQIYEGKAGFLIDLERGHKTSFYLDQRRSRLALSSISKNKIVLDLFCYTGGFSINAALGGAKKVTGVDIKEDWLEMARKNAGLNGVRENVDFVNGDAFLVLKKMLDFGEKFDIIILDPPSFAKDKKALVTASKGYKELNALAMKSLSPGGILATFSCSHNMPNDVFSRILKEAAAIAGKKWAILKRCRQDRDHPIIKAIPETEYLKGYFLKF